MSLTISIDAMGGDYGPEVTIPASLDCLKNNPDLKLILVGDEAVLNPQLAQALIDFQDRLTIQHASQCVGMDESPSKALKNKKTHQCGLPSTWFMTGAQMLVLVPAIPGL